MYGAPVYGAPAPVYVAPAPAYVAPAPAYVAPAPAYYPPPAGPTIITIGNTNDSGTHCPTCGHNTGAIPRKKIGTVAILWCLCLLFTVGAYGLCLIPLCSDNCKDTELTCTKCQTIKARI